MLWRVVPNTLLLMGDRTFAIGIAGGVALGTWQASRHGTAAERVSSGVALGFVSAPEFLVALAASAVFSMKWRLFPVSGMGDPALHDSYSAAGRMLTARHLALPALTLGVLIAAGVSRFQRSEMLGILPEDFVRTARATGASGRRVLWRHAFPNAMSSIIALIGLLLPAVFGGTVFVEMVFSWPGMGLTMVNAVLGRDYQLVVGAVLLGSVAVAVGAATTDLLAALTDPRTRRSA